MGIDVVIITAAEGEDDAVRQVVEGGIGSWTAVDGPDGFQLPLHARDFETRNGKPLRVVLCRPFKMGTDAAMNAAAQLVAFFRPQCVAMSGVCAGRPGWTCLGDVIVADQLWRYDEGEQENTEPGKAPKYRAEGVSYNLRPSWKRCAEELIFKPQPAWLNERPLDRQLQALWVLRECYEGRDPMQHAQRKMLCPDWGEVVPALRTGDVPEVALQSGRLTLTDAGRERIEAALIDNAGSLPTQEAWRIQVKPIGTGANLVRDVDIWDRLADQKRLVAGLEMEASVIGLVAKLQDVRHHIVVKGVMDHAEPERHRGFRPFAARAAAEVLLRLLRENLEPRGRERILREGTSPLPEAFSPASLLVARHRVVEFVPEVHEQAIAHLESWRSTEGNGDIVRVVLGQGGAGKTRLMVEWGQQLRDQGWNAGFLRDNAPVGDIDGVLDDPRPACIVVDYAEVRTTLPMLLDHIDRRLEQRGAQPLRIALLARNEGEWLQAVDKAMGPCPRLHLPPMSLEGDARGDLFAKAVSAFAQRQGKPTPATTPDLGHENFGRPLYVSAAALAAVEGLAIEPVSLLDEIVVHERRVWMHRAGPEAGSDVEMQEFADGAARLVAAITLRGGVDDRERAEALAERVGAPGSAFLRVLHGLYPGDRSAPNPPYIGSLEPDLLGESLVASVLASPHSPVSFLPDAAIDATEQELSNAFVVLGRLAWRGHDRAAAWAERLLDTNVQRCAQPLIEAVLTLGRETAFSTLANLLTDRLEAIDEAWTLPVAVATNDLIPEQTVALRRYAVWALQRLLDSDLDDQGRAALLNDLGNRLSDLGRREDALAATRESVDHYRTLAATRPDAFLPDLAMSLNNLGNSLGALGHREDALAASRESVDHYQTLTAARPDVFLPYLAASLNNLGNRLSDLGHREDALAAARDSVDHYRTLAATRPDAFLPVLALSLNNLGARLSYLGHREDALAATREAVDVGRNLAAARPDAFLPDLAASLNNLGAMLSDLGHREDGLAATQEAVDHYRTLAATRPDAFMPDLAMSLNNLGNRLSDLGRREDALAATRESVDHYRTLAATRPDAFLPDLAMSLNNLGSILSDLGHREDALAAARDSVDHYRTLAATRPDAFLPDLAMSLNNLGTRLSALGHREDALTATREAVDHFRALAAARPDAFLPDLASSVNNLGNRLSALGHREDALAATREAVDHYRTLAAARPDAFLPDLASSVNNLGGRLRDLGRNEDALAAAQESVTLSVGLTDALPSVFGEKLGSRLSNLFRLHKKAGTRPEDDPVVHSAIECLMRHGLLKKDE